MKKFLIAFCSIACLVTISTSAFAVTPADIQACTAKADSIQATLDGILNTIDDLQNTYDTDQANWQAKCDNIAATLPINKAALAQCRAQMKAALATDKNAIKSKNLLASTTKRQLSTQNSLCRKLQSQFNSLCNKNNSALNKALRKVDSDTNKMNILQDQITAAKNNYINVQANYDQRMAALKSRQDAVLVTKGIACIAAAISGDWSQCDSLASQVISIQTQMSNLAHQRTTALLNAQQKIDRQTAKVAPLQVIIDADNANLATVQATFNQSQCPAN